MDSIKGAVRKHLRDRPFDFYVAAMIFLAGAYSVFSPDWPESVHGASTSILIYIVSIYMMIASAIVMASLLCNRQKRPIFAILAEMWGWLAISASSTAAFLMYTYMIATLNAENIAVSTVLDFVWLGLALASGLRSLDIYLVTKGRR